MVLETPDQSFNIDGFCLKPPQAMARLCCRSEAVYCSLALERQKPAERPNKGQATFHLCLYFGTYLLTD